MLTSFDDPEIARFLKSIPFFKRKRFVTHAIGEWKFQAAVCFFCLPIFLLPIVAKLCGIWWLVLMVPLAATGVIRLFVFRNRELRKSMQHSLVNGKFLNCPACRLPQHYNDGETCDCGCLIRPFGFTASDKTTWADSIVGIRIVQQQDDNVSTRNWS